MKKLLASASLSLALLAAGPVIAQENSQGYNDPAAGAQQASYNDAELKQFIEAQKDINGIRDEYMTKIENVDSQEKAQELQIEANGEMAEAIDEAGLDIPTYNAIATAYNSNPQVRDRVDSMM
ncbi:DUF4168 domain-containing protein [Marinobacter sp.]|uniref:DUF4168 domain-containing protein n=1 Tax=Marinobacter sp. TaxID=50741 RepID=UPI003850735E